MKNMFADNFNKANKTPECIIASPKDSDKVVEIVNTVFGKNYWDPNMYDSAYVKNLIANEDCKVYALVENNKFLTMFIASNQVNFKKTLLLRSLMTVRDFRAHGNTRILLDYFFKNYNFSNCLSVNVYAVTGHDISQRIAQEYGFVNSGALINAYIGESSYFITNPHKMVLPKRTDLMAVKNVDITNVGKIYIPDALKDTAQNVYGLLKVKTEFANDLSKTDSQKESVFDVYNYPNRLNTEIVVRSVGGDAYSRITEIIHNQVDHALQTFQIFVNIKESSSIALIDKLMENGFYFSGLKPLGENEEYAMLYYSKYILPSIADWELTNENKELFALITKTWGKI